MKYCSLFLYLGFLCSCNNSNQATKKANIDTVSPASEEETVQHLVDTKCFAEYLLDGRAKASDNYETFDCLDSLVSKNAATRKYYYPVGKIIMNQSDGALSEALGLYLKNYLEQYPSEAVGHYSEMTSKEQKNFIEHIAFEFGTGDTALLNRYKAATTANCTNCPPKKIADLNKIIVRINTSAKQNVE